MITFFKDAKAPATSQVAMEGVDNLAIQVDGEGPFEIEVIGSLNAGGSSHVLAVYPAGAELKKASSITAQGIYYPLVNEGVKDVRVRIKSITGAVSVYGQQ